MVRARDGFIHCLFIHVRLMYCCPAPRRRRPAARANLPRARSRAYTHVHTHPTRGLRCHTAQRYTLQERRRRPRRPPRSLSLSCLACRRLHSRHASHPTRTRTRLTPSRSAQTPRRASGGADDAARYSPQIARTHSHGGWSGLLPPHARRDARRTSMADARRRALTSLVDSHCRHVPPSRA